VTRSSPVEAVAPPGGEGGTLEEVTDTSVCPEMFPDVAVTVVVPADNAVTSPELLTVATRLFDDAQVTDLEITLVVLSEYIPEAEICWDAPRAILEMPGEKVMYSNATEDGGVGLVTVTRVDPEVLPCCAIIVEDPAETAVTSPLLLMVTTVSFDELHVTESVRSSVVPLSYMPTAENCWDPDKVSS